MGKNNLRIILGTKSKIFKNIEARQNIRCSKKKNVYCISLKLFFNWDFVDGHLRVRR